ncbi:MAG: SDR family oxidoreductase [Flavobacteriales bacterium]|nr:SDR family oxidoreductase [Flavobacteriales bacterium]
MKILLTGATGYIGKRLLPILVNQGHNIVCCVRDLDRFHTSKSIRQNITVIKLDLLDQNSLKLIPKDIDGAYYLVHSMSSSKDYLPLEEKSALNFKNALKNTSIKHLIYLSGIINDSRLSKHLTSRKNVEMILSEGSYNFTSLRAGIIIGSGSASFEIIRDLVEKLPVMIAPKWLKTKCQPIGISDVLLFLSKCLFNQKTFNRNFDIGGPDVLSYKNMLLDFARVRNFYRKIFIVPVMSPRISSYWLYFITSTSYKLAVSLVNSMKVEIICRNHHLNTILGIKPLTYKDALRSAFDKIQNNQIISSWKDSYISSDININISDFIKVPSFGCYKDEQQKKYKNHEDCLEKIWSIGGANGWYFGNWLWKIRGFIDKLVGGVGLRRGRTSKNSIFAGDTLDFWRVLYANKEEGRLLLFAEMKLPGDAWLEFKLESGKIIQTSTFRPLGVLGRFYWLSTLIFHKFIFKGMLKKLSN